MYHVVPDPLIGTTLYPLNQLKTINPTLYENAVSKYRVDPARHRRDRRKLMQRTIPILNCRWNDVLHSSTVHPQNLMDMWRAAGYTPKFALTMFEIPLAMLDSQRTVIYKHTSTYFKGMRWNYTRYDPDTYAHYSVITEKAKRTMRELVARQAIWHFLHIPHVLYEGTIATDGLPRITILP